MESIGKPCGRRVTGLSNRSVFLFLLKGLFKGRHVDTARYLPVSEPDHPALFAFLRQLCGDTGAPFPRQVFVDAEVNAAVFYDSSLLSLVLPVRKNLLIGLGLVNVLDLSEFKAVLAHEFGHFSQSSMKVGSYVYTANRVIADMVYGRDAWDNLLRDWQNGFPPGHLRLGPRGVVWVLRKGLAGIFRVLNFANLALSRQMEFNADLVAVQRHRQRRADPRPGQARLCQPVSCASMQGPSRRFRPSALFRRSFFPSSQGRSPPADAAERPAARDSPGLARGPRRPRPSFPARS